MGLPQRVAVVGNSGSGKSNQMFLRGFNLDHGTDFATWIDGMPINMPTHGHGQGYADLNFLIPELVERAHYRKGPYFAEVGDFSSAGGVDFDFVGTQSSGPMDMEDRDHEGYNGYAVAQVGEVAVERDGASMQHDDPTGEPIIRWRAHASLLFSNWLNHYVYQVTPYDWK